MEMRGSAHTFFSIIQNSKNILLRRHLLSVISFFESFVRTQNANRGLKEWVYEHHWKQPYVPDVTEMKRIMDETGESHTVIITSLRIMREVIKSKYRTR